MTGNEASQSDMRRSEDTRTRGSFKSARGRGRMVSFNVLLAELRQSMLRLDELNECLYLESLLASPLESHPALCYCDAVESS